MTTHARTLRNPLTRALAAFAGAATLIACGEDTTRLDLPAGSTAETTSNSLISAGAASGFAILGGPAVTCTRSELLGSVGAGFPGAPITNTECTMTGTSNAGNGAAAAAYNDFLLAYIALEDIDCPTDPASILTGTLADVTLAPGTYCFDAAAALTGVLTLDAAGDPNAEWLIKVGSGPAGGALTGTSFSVVMAGGGLPCNVTWWVDAAATMTTSSFQGRLFAGAGITFTDGSFVGQALAKAAVTVTDMNPFGGCTATSSEPCKRKEDRITGGGYIKLSHRTKATFAVSAGFKRGALRGELTYQEHSGNGIKVKGTGVTQYLVVDEVTRYIEGTAKVNGTAGFTYQVTVSDNGEPGNNDTFALEVRDASGALIYSASGPVKGGNIQLHKARQGSCDDDGHGGHGHGDHDDDDDDDDHDDRDCRGGGGHQRR